MGQHLSYPGNIVTGTLNSVINASGTPTFQVTGWPTTVGIAGQPFVVEVGPGLGDDEKILVSSFSAGVATVASSGRGWDGTASVAHVVGEQVRCVPDATSFQDFSDHVYVNTRDDHTQYLNVTRHDVTARHGSTVVSHSLIGGLTNDDHTQYYNQTRHDAHMHPASCLPSGSASVIDRTHLSGAAQGMPVGSLIPIPGGISGTEANYLIPADGSNVSRATWPLLFARYGTTYGAGDGSTTFGVPDCRSRMVIGSSGSTIGDGVRTNRAEAATGGTETHQLATNEMPSHTHVVIDSGHGHAVGDGGHTHAGGQGFGISDGWIATRNSSSTNATSSTGNGDKLAPTAPGSIGSGVAATGVTVGTGNAQLTATTVGSGAAHSLLNPYIAVPIYVVAA